MARRGPGNRKRNAADDSADEARRKRRDEVWRLRTVEGLSFARIAHRMGIALGTVESDIKQAREEHKPPDVEELAAFVRTELHNALDGLRRSVKSGKPQAVQAQVKALDAFCKLHGLYAPEKHEVSAILNEPTPAQARAAIKEVFKKNVEPYAGDASDAASSEGKPPES